MLFGAVWPAQLGFYVLATAPTFALAWLSWHGFEAPILKLKSRFPYEAADNADNKPQMAQINRPQMASFGSYRRRSAHTDLGDLHDSV